MKNIYDVLRQKELEVQQLQKELEALRIAARLLTDDSDVPADSFAKGNAVSTPVRNVPPVIPGNGATTVLKQFP